MKGRLRSFSTRIKRFEMRGLRQDSRSPFADFLARQSSWIRNGKKSQARLGDSEGAKL